MTTELRERFVALCGRLRLQLAAGETFDELERLHQTPPRAYHDLTHVAECLGELDRAVELATDAGADAVELALWYHDAILDNRRPENEQKSAHLARQTLGAAGAPTELQSQVEALILATRHEALPESADERLVVDCDLAILGQERERFEAYDRAIRVEYSWVPREVYGEKRAAVLRQFLARERIYATELFWQRYERRARENLLRAVDLLR